MAGHWSWLLLLHRYSDSSPPQLAFSHMDYAQIERAAKIAMDRERKRTGEDDIVRDVAKAIAAAIAEYDRQKSKTE